MFLSILRTIDELLNGITMYRAMLYFLIILWILSATLSLVDALPFNFLEITASSFVILGACYISNKLFSKIFKVSTNLESTYITALILIFIILPAKSFPDFVFIALASVFAMGSKYALAINKKHIFNPAGIAVFLTAIFSIGYASWWIGNFWTLIPILIGGLLIVKKIQRISLIVVFLITFLGATLYFSFINQSDIPSTIKSLVLDSPILFFSFVMLVEPLTSPTRKKMQIIYGILVGVLAGSQFSIGPFYSTHETALVLGNIFAFLVGFRRRLVLTFLEKSQIANGVYELKFNLNKKFAYLPGQYLEWTLSHNKPDSRGVRRYFTIASSPTEDTVRLGIKINKEKSSSFKKTLMDLENGSKINAGQLGGDFVLPENKSEKLVFIAGGIGITPFRSIVKYLIDKKEKRDIVLFYCASDVSDLVYRDLFESAKSIGLKTHYVCTRPPQGWKGKTGRIDEEMIKEEVLDFSVRTFYLSGPSAMVDGYKKLLKSLGIKPQKIVTDYFPGY